MIPVITIQGRSLPEVWEKSVMELWRLGMRIPTDYDKADSPQSIDSTTIMVVREPFAEPRIHRAFPAGLDDLEIYRQEVVNGVHDHWIDPDNGKWSYTYHSRIYEYGADYGGGVDQINYVLKNLSNSWHSRRAQAITFIPPDDYLYGDPPCLQRLWFRLTKEGDAMYLNMNTHWRSRDAYKAAFMNMFALTDLQRKIASDLSDKMGKTVLVGQYTDISDSYHIYGDYLPEVQKFVARVGSSSIWDRVWTSEFAQPFFEDGVNRLAKESNQAPNV